jgi:glycosyltransferase involved in cell wall biosynthesis
MSGVKDKAPGETVAALSGHRLLRAATRAKTVGRRRRLRDVAFYIPQLGPLVTPHEVLPTGGAETQIYLIARRLARYARVCLVVCDLPGHSMPPSIDDVEIVVRPPFRTHERLGKLRETMSIRRAVADAAADVVVARTAGPDVGVVGFFTKLSGRRFVYSSANVSDFTLALTDPKRLNQWLFRLGVRLADDIVVQTAEQVGMCQERYGRSSVLIPSIAEPAARRRAEPEAFLWIGRVVSYKRPLAYIELARSLPDVRFWMLGVPSIDHYGGPDLMRAVESAAADVPNLELLSPRPRNRLMDLIDRAVAVVNTADFEGMPNILLEGWARGVPALALTHDPDGVIERHGLGQFAGGSNERLRAAARLLWDGRGDQAELADKCRRYVQKRHSPEAVSARWQRVLGIEDAPGNVAEAQHSG